MLQTLAEIGSVERITEILRRAKDKNDPFRLAGFGHRIYKSYDPRAKVLRGTVKLAGSGAWWSRVGQVNGRDDDASRSDLCRPSLPRRDHQLRGIALSSVPIEPAHG